MLALAPISRTRLLRGRAPFRSGDRAPCVRCAAGDSSRQDVDSDQAFDPASAVNWVFSPSATDASGQLLPSFVPPLAAEHVKRQQRQQKALPPPRQTGLARFTATDALQLTLAAATGLAAPPVDLGGEVEPQIKRQSSRRSRTLAFTCNVCGHRSRRRVNPSALDTGTVFVQCANASCMVFHKVCARHKAVAQHWTQPWSLTRVSLSTQVADHLGLFHELSGPVFVPPPIRDDSAPSPAQRHRPVGLGGWAAAAGLDVDDLLMNINDEMK